MQANGRDIIIQFLRTNFGNATTERGHDSRTDLFKPNKISGDKQGIAAEMIERMKPLYALEARLREVNADHRTRKRLRQKIARPILHDIHTWLRSIKSKVLPKSKLGKAISYTLNQWPFLVAYLRHGMAEIDTNYVYPLYITG